MNFATIIGIIGGVAVLGYATYSTAEGIRLFVNLPGLAIVLGGVAASTFICYPLKDVFRVFHVFLMALKREDLPMADYISELEYLSVQAFRKGALKLEKELEGMENYFLKDGIKMVVDEYSPEKVKEIMENRIKSTYEREMTEAAIMRTMAKMSPAFGIVGTLIGLISLMKNMTADRMDSLGISMAVALITTFYGILLANLIFYPIAVKVERRIEERVVLMNIIKEGILLIIAKTPPAMVVEKLKSFLPPRKWASIKPRAIEVEAGGGAAN